MSGVYPSSVAKRALKASEWDLLTSTYNLNNKRPMSATQENLNRMCDVHFGCKGFLAQLRSGCRNISQACGVLCLIDEAVQARDASNNQNASGVEIPPAGEERLHGKPLLTPMVKSGRTTHFKITGDLWCYECGSEKRAGEACICLGEGRCDLNVFASSVHGVSGSTFADPFPEGFSREHKVPMSFPGQQAPCVWREGTEDGISGWCRVCGVFVGGRNLEKVGREQREKSLWTQHTQCSEHRFYRAIENLHSGLQLVQTLRSNPDPAVDEFVGNLHMHVSALKLSAGAVQSG